MLVMSELIDVILVVTELLPAIAVQVYKIGLHGQKLAVTKYLK